jgi:hypothetical protein
MISWHLGVTLSYYYYNNIYTGCSHHKSGFQRGPAKLIVVIKKNKVADKYNQFLSAGLYLGKGVWMTFGKIKCLLFSIGK